MEKEKLHWKTFALRRRLDIKSWLKSKNIKTYSEFVLWCKSKDIIPPNRSVLKDCFSSKTKTTTKKRNEKKSNLKSKKSEILINEIDKENKNKEKEVVESKI